ncbi:hypothetical protein [Desertivirga xinjiangensis]|uniref:hypothetical protein n=1 Tax=Desertivirga xinjiangensis TaxID=539206 RepID=UPI00210C213B|nr:hypothetical protein [Pedobacter xinjiangensis]
MKRTLTIKLLSTFLLLTAATLFICSCKAKEKSLTKTKADGNKSESISNQTNTNVIDKTITSTAQAIVEENSRVEETSVNVDSIKSHPDGTLIIYTGGKPMTRKINLTGKKNTSGSTQVNTDVEINQSSKTDIRSQRDSTSVVKTEDKNVENKSTGKAWVISAISGTVIIIILYWLIKSRS